MFIVNADNRVIFGNSMVNNASTLKSKYLLLLAFLFSLYIIET